MNNKQLVTALKSFSRELQKEAAKRKYSTFMAGNREAVLDRYLDPKEQKAVTAQIAKKDFNPVAVDPFGNFVGTKGKSSKMYFLDHETGKEVQVADNMKDFKSKLIKQATDTRKVKWQKTTKQKNIEAKAIDDLYKKYDSQGKLTAEGKETKALGYKGLGDDYKISKGIDYVTKVATNIVPLGSYGASTKRLPLDEDTRKVLLNHQKRQTKTLGAIFGTTGAIAGGLTAGVPGAILGAGVGVGINSLVQRPAKKRIEKAKSYMLSTEGFMNPLNAIDNLQDATYSLEKHKKLPYRIKVNTSLRP